MPKPMTDEYIELRGKFFAWLDQKKIHPGIKPKNQKEWSEQYGVHRETLNRWKKAYLEEKKMVAVSAKMADKDKELGVIDQFKKLMGTLALDPTRPTKDRELFAKMNSLVTDKSEQKVTIELTASDYAREYFNAIRYLRENGFTPGVGSLLTQPAILCDEVCVDNQQEHVTESEMGAVGLSPQVT